MLKVDQNSVQARPATEARFRPADFGEGRAIAQGAEQLGQGLYRASETLDKIGEQYDTAAVKQADADDLKKIIEIKGQAMAAEGFDAQTAVANARQQIADIRKERLATLKNERQRNMYTDVFDQRSLQIEEAFGNHLTKQTHEAEKNAATARAETYADLARESYGTAAFDTNMATTMSEIAAINKGAGPDVIGRAQAQARSKILSGVVDNLLSSHEHVQEAKLALEKNAKDILPEDETALRKKLNPLLEEDQTESDAGWAFTNSPAPAGEQPTEGPDTPPRPSIEGPSSRSEPAAKPVSPTDPLRGKGRVTNTAAQHRARGSGNALDIAAPAGTPIYTPMSGKVIKNWWSEEGGWSLLVEHPNGYVTGYAHMRSQSPLAEGSQVDASIPIGSVGMTGTKATGPHVHYTVRQSKAGPKVDPNAVDWGDTVKPESVSWKEGGLTRYEADQNALGRAMNRLYDRASKENWSQRRYQQAVERVRQIAGVQDQLYNQRQEDMWQSAIAKVVELGDGFTSLSQIPNYGLLDPTRQLALKNMAQGNLNPSDERKANSPTFLNYLRQSYEDRDNWLKSPSFLTDAKITNGERRQLYERYLQLTQDPNGQLASNMNEATSMATRFLPKDYEGRGEFMDRYMAAVERRQRELGKPLTDPEKLDIARALTVHTIRYSAATGKPVGEGYSFETLGQRGEKAQVNIQDTFNSIPQSRREEIANLLRSQHRAYSPRAIVEFYLQNAR